MMHLTVQTQVFEGPLPLLLYLIRKNEIDIYDIPIHDITKQYLEYIQIMKELNLEIAGEFIAMAATLIYIKSRMLVPQYDEHGEEVQVDPRKELVQKLLEYQKFQEASKLLYRRPLLGRDLWLKGAREVITAGGLKPVDDIELDEKGLYALIAAFRRLAKAATKGTHTVQAKGMSIAYRLTEIKHKFTLGERTELRLLLEEGYTKTDLIITFLCVLELARMGYIRVFQSETLGPLYLDTIKVVSEDIFKRVQEFDAGDTEATANKIMSDAELDMQTENMSALAESQVDLGSLDNDQEILAVESGELA